jgi:antitoxin StbD
MLLKHADQAISSTDLQKKTRELLDRISGGKQDHYVVMRDNRPAAVMMATERYEALIEELQDLRIEAVARAHRGARHPESDRRTAGSRRAGQGRQTFEW